MTCVCKQAMDQVLAMLDDGTHDIPRIAASWYDDLRSTPPALDDDVAANVQHLRDHYLATLMMERLKEAV